MFIKDKYIRPQRVEKRQYQVNIANSASKENTLVVLPTGLGKTIIALLLIVKKIKNNNEKILFLAPTKPLVVQHAQFLKQFLTIQDECISIFTGEISPLKRKSLWKNSKIIVSTPQVVENDLISRQIELSEVCLIIFDEAHHAVGDYAYVFISEMYGKQREKPHILGITASPGNDEEKILNICRNLNIQNIEIRTKEDDDVKPYIFELKIYWREILLPKEFSSIVQLLRKSLAKRLESLYEMGFIDSSSISLINRTKLLDSQTKIQYQIRSQLKPSKEIFRAASRQSEALKIHYAIELFQTQGVSTVKNYFNRIRQEAFTKGGSKSSKVIMNDSTIIEAIALINSIEIDHPKLPELSRIIKEQLDQKRNSKNIIFTHYRDTSIKVKDTLNQIDNARPVRFIGQAARNGDKGLTQKQQLSIIKKFKDGDYNILIATSVAEEGLDIPSTDLVVFYEPIPSEIRAIQRRGRTGRKTPGKVVILITKGTPDEGYYWAAKRKEKRMKTELELLRSKLKKKLEKKSFSNFNKSSSETNQKILSDFENNEDKIKIIVDYREYRSNVVTHLIKKEVSIIPQQLQIGDYVISSRIGIERKNVNDYLESLMQGKLFSQLSLLRDAYARPILILEGENLLTKRNINHNAILGSLASIVVDFGITIIPCKDPLETADFLKAVANREQRGKQKSVVALRGFKPSMTTKERQQFFLEGFPNVSSILAQRLLDHFGSIKDLVNATQEELMEVEGVGKRISAEIISIIHNSYKNE